jgi:catechol 2,3-dioxygenase-like lactoylglutathione lyase family enzyme
VPDITSKDLAQSRAFYVDFFGFEMTMDMGFVMTFVSPSNPTVAMTNYGVTSEPPGDRPSF